MDLNELIEKSQILGSNLAATIETLLAKLLMVPFFGIEEKLLKIIYTNIQKKIFFNYNKFEKSLT